MSVDRLTLCGHPAGKPAHRGERARVLQPPFQTVLRGAEQVSHTPDEASLLAAVLHGARAAPVVLDRRGRAGPDWRPLVVQVAGPQPGSNQSTGERAQAGFSEPSPSPTASPPPRWPSADIVVAEAVVV